MSVRSWVFVFLNSSLTVRVGMWLLSPSGVLVGLMLRVSAMASMMVVVISRLSVSLCDLVIAKYSVSSAVMLFSALLGYLRVKLGLYVIVIIGCAPQITMWWYHPRIEGVFAAIGWYYPVVLS